MQFGAGGVEYQVDRVKDKVTLSDLLNGTSPMSETLQKNYEMYKLANPESEMGYGAYKNTFLQYGAFEYTSIRDQQLSKERWVNVGLVAGIVVASVICPVVGTALAMGVSSVELYSAISGTNVYSGRELTTGERISSGAIAVVGMGLSGYSMYKFFKNPGVIGQVEKAGETGGKYNTKIDSKVIEIEKANLRDDIEYTYTDGQYRTVETLEEVKVYRTYGGRAKQNGGYATTSATTTRIDAKIDTALLPEWGNSRQYEIEITIPKGQPLNIGKVAWYYFIWRS